MSKATCSEINLLAGCGVDGDAHAGATVQHRSRVARDPLQPNLRQVHAIHAELFEELASQGFTIGPGVMGENITTRGLAILELPRGARLRFPSGATIEVTGLRNPCAQLDGIQPGLMQAVLERDRDGGLIRKAGIMAVVVESGVVRAGDTIVAELPPGPHQLLEPV